MLVSLIFLQLYWVFGAGPGPLQRDVAVSDRQQDELEVLRRGAEGQEHGHGIIDT